jgi:hypothetical protein
VRELVLLVPGLFLSSDAVTALGTWRFATPRRLKGGWRAAFARRLGRDDLAHANPASVVAASAGLPSDTWLATPLHLIAGLTTLHLPAEGVLCLSAEEARELAAGFASIFGNEGLVLHPLEDGSLLLSGLRDCAAETVDPALLSAQAASQGLASAQPVGEGAASLRALMTEIEMWLHDLPLNLERERTGLPPIRSLWLWGGGVSAAPVARDRDRDSVSKLEGKSIEASTALCVYTQDSWARACCGLSGIDCKPLDLCPEFFAGIAADLQRGELSKLTLVNTDCAVSVCSGDRWRWWRPRRDALSALTASV